MIKDRSVFSHVLERYVATIMQLHFPEAVHSEGKYHFRCNVCGDSKTKKSKKRGTILPRNEYKNKPSMFVCLNCNASMTTETWMRTYFVGYWEEYLREIFKASHGDEPKLEIKTDDPPKIVKPKPPEDLYEETKFFRPIFKDKCGIYKIAQDYCIKRLIPENYWHKWYVAVGGALHDRLIIPFYGKNGEIHSYQGRALKPWLEPKYLGPKIHDGQIFNFHLVNENKPVIVLEGLIDSTFVKNSIALTGLKLNQDLSKFKHKFWLLDNDVAGRTRSLELLCRGEKVFIWRKFIKSLGLVVDPNKKTDINDIVLMTKKTSWCFEDFESFFSSNIIDKIWLS